MSPVKLDGLWHSLCPSFRQSFVARAFRPVSSVNPPNIYYNRRRRSKQRRNAQRQGAGPDPSSQSPSVGLREEQIPLQPARDEWPRLSEWHAITQLSTEQAYSELQQASIQGEYNRVKEYIRMLVQERDEEPNVRLYSAMVLANTHPKHGSPTEVQGLLKEMEQHGIAPDSAIYHAALKVLSIHSDYLFRQEILEKLYQGWFALTPDGWHDVIAGLIRDRQWEVALKKLETVEQQGVEIKPWLYDLLVYNLCELSEFDEALRIMQRRFFSGEVLISQTLWYHLLDSASRSFHHEIVAFVWRHRVGSGYLQPPSGICVNVLNTAARHGDPKLATAVFYTLSGRNHTFRLHHYEALLEAWLASGDLKAAFTITSVMQQTRIRTTAASTRAIFLYLTDDYGRPAEALKILQQLKDEDRPIPHAALNVVLEAFIHYNDLGSALETYKSMHMIIPSGPNTSTFNTLFRGCTHARRKDLAMFLASEMLALNVPPNELTYDRLILSCLNARGEPDGGFEDGWRYFEEMRSMDWWPRSGTWKLLGEKGCEIADQRVWRLVDKERGFNESRMEYLVRKFWGKQVSRSNNEENTGEEQSHVHDAKSADEEEKRQAVT